MLDFVLIDFVISAARPVRFRGKYRLLDPIVPHSGIRMAQVFGAVFELNLAEFIQRTIYMGVYELNETRMVANYLKPGMTVIDVGANVGYYTALAASKIGSSGRIYAVEPDLKSFAQLQKLLADNPIPARAFNFGIGLEGTQNLYLSPASNNHAPTMVSHDDHAPISTVTMRRLDDCLDEWNIEVCDLLKIDIEGWEAQAFAGAKRSLGSRRIRAILCEFNDFWLRAAGSSAAQLWETLVGYGYKPQNAASKLDTYFLIAS
jgi:FkbM family methyltransferase